MLGFEARSDGGEPRASDGELDDVRWFTREEVIDGINGANPELLLPPSVSIARLLIERWIEQGGKRPPTDGQGGRRPPRPRPQARYA
jgi:NAD+ diphosphatase